jgi:sugar phosphate isomerase/epimerase
MHYGMPALLEIDSIEDCAALCRELGLSFIELNMNLPQYQVENIDVARFFDTARSNGIHYTIHLDEGFNVCDFNSRIAEGYLETALQTIEIAKRLGMPL